MGQDSQPPPVVAKFLKLADFMGRLDGHGPSHEEGENLIFTRFPGVELRYGELRELADEFIRLYQRIEELESATQSQNRDSGSQGEGQEQRQGEEIGPEQGEVCGLPSAQHTGEEQDHQDRPL